MSFQVSAVAAPSLNPVPETTRRSANYHPSIWGDRFLTYPSELSETDNEKIQLQLQELKKEVRKMLMAPGEKSSEKLKFIDAIHRLGVSYHFENEIQQILQTLHDSHDHEHDDDDDDLYTVALRFRLLRQHGYYSSPDTFTKFKDSKGNFKKSLINDVQGMLSLYEATHLRVHGEEILDEALVFTATHLESVATHLSPLLASQVSHALKQPIHKGLPRLEARYYFSIYPQDASHNEVLLTFAKLDFNQLQKLHQKELSEIARWWKDCNFSRELPFTRDRVVECYFWILGVYFEPEYLLARRMLTKVIAMTSIIDDIYDVYGTLEELELFTQAIERWDIGAIDQLPEYMKVCYRALLDVYSEMDQKIGEGRSYRARYAREAMKNQVRAYFQEAKWFHKKHIPTMDEYMRTALVTTGYNMLATTSLVGMGDVVTQDAFEWLFKNPKMIRASEVVCRLMDDIVSHKFEQKRGHCASAIECYTVQHGATEEEAVDEFRKEITGAWKDINEECLYPTTVPMLAGMRILNFTRVIDVIYKDEDGYTYAEIVLKDFVTSLLVDPVPS
ncbi:(-)-germacrene D synthase-like isoform X2 [Corylus avellana]|uniref:(-)-germacrene D synthase-like isoform X2 n=1 Tax=Corylus avellana TaxID=13451 RepID=UPI001E21AB68|nr:(-)-germacrene D synthase-like isoform X2 [Corylus avellana]